MTLLPWPRHPPLGGRAGRREAPGSFDFGGWRLERAFGRRKQILWKSRTNTKMLLLTEWHNQESTSPFHALFRPSVLSAIHAVMPSDLTAGSSIDTIPWFQPQRPRR